MITDIKVGKVVELSSPKNKFVLYLETVHGDADHYETQTFTWDREVAIKYWNLISVFFERGLRNRYVDEDYLKMIIENRSRELNIDDHWEAYCEIVGYDIIYHGITARPESMWLTYFDENGIEHEVDEPKRLG